MVWQTSKCQTKSVISIEKHSLELETAFSEWKIKFFSSFHCKFLHLWKKTRRFDICVENLESSIQSSLTLQNLNFEDFGSWSCKICKKKKICLWAIWITSFLKYFSHEIFLEKSSSLMRNKCLSKRHALKFSRIGILYSSFGIYIFESLTLTRFQKFL